MIQIQSQTKAG